MFSNLDLLNICFNILTLIFLSSVQSQSDCSCSSLLSNWQCTGQNGIIYQGGNAGFQECVDERTDIWENTVDCRYCYKCTDEGSLGQCECDYPWNCGTGIADTLHYSAFDQDVCLPTDICHEIRDNNYNISSKITCDSNNDIYIHYYQNLACNGTESVINVANISSIDGTEFNNLKCDNCKDYYHARKYHSNCSSDPIEFGDEIYPLGCLNVNQPPVTPYSILFECTNSTIRRAMFDGFGCKGNPMSNTDVRYHNGCGESAGVWFWNNGTGSLLELSGNYVQILYCGQVDNNQMTTTDSTAATTKKSSTISTQSSKESTNPTTNNGNLSWINKFAFIGTFVVYFLI